MLKKVLNIKSLWASGKNIYVQLDFLETDGLVAFEAEEESDCGVVAPEAPADPMGLSQLSPTDSRVKTFYSPIQQLLASGCPMEGGITMNKTASWG